jgi:hypothetical protein
MIRELPRLEGWERLVADENGCFPLPDVNTIYHDEPLLKYVRKMAAKLIPGINPFSMVDYMSIVDCFVGRYFSGEIDSSFQDEYESSTELLETLKGYGIETDAFWYLILFLKDYIDDAMRVPEDMLTMREKLIKLEHALLDSESSIRIEAKGKIDYDEKLLYQFLSYSIHQTLPEMDKDDFYDKFHLYATEESSALKYDNPFDFLPPKQRPLVLTHKQCLLHDYLSRFLKGYKRGDKTSFKLWIPHLGRSFDARISYDKTLLISRVLYIIGYTATAKDMKFYEESKEKNGPLKNILTGKDKYLSLRLVHGASYSIEL